MHPQGPAGIQDFSNPLLVAHGQGDVHEVHIVALKVFLQI